MKAVFHLRNLHLTGLVKVNSILSRRILFWDEQSASLRMPQLASLMNDFLAFFLTVGNDVFRT